MQLLRPQKETGAASPKGGTIRLVAARLWQSLAIRLGSALVLALFIWFAAPILNIGSLHPFDDTWPRIVLVCLVFLSIGLAEGFRSYRRRQGAEQIARSMSVDDSDAPVLAERMQKALATLREATGGRGNYLYDLPWYVMIGPPGSGKTTALRNAGLEFPLAEGTHANSIEGIGGTRYCDWWFTNDAVLIDTAGRYTTQDSDAKADQKSWLAFLDLLKRSRPRQPINGVIVAISVEDILTYTAEDLTANANVIRARLIELHERLRVDFPVYALFTKADLITGFMEYFNDLSEGSRRQVWGCTFQTSDKTRNMIASVPTEFDALILRLNEGLQAKLEKEKDPTSRVQLFGFPAQMAALQKPVSDFLEQIFAPARYPIPAALRGFYFTSGTQHGTPIDQLLGALTKTFGAQGIAPPVFSGQGKSFFLTDLVKLVIIGEAGWVTRVRRNSLLTAAAYGLLIALVPIVAGLLYVSYRHNADLIAQSEEASSDYQALTTGFSRANTISDRDFGKVLPPLHALRFMPGGYEERNDKVISLAGFGLGQSARLRSAAETSYEIGLERLLRPRLVYRVEELLDQNPNDPAFLYQALKVYLMLGGLKTVDRPLLISFIEHDWSENLYPGPKNTAGRKELEEHLLAMLDLDTGHHSFVSLNGPLVERSQATLARVAPAQRAFEILRERAKATLIEDWLATRNAGNGALVVFDDSLTSIKVPYFFTHAGFEHGFVDELASIKTAMTKDRWILGRFGEQPLVQDQYQRLLPDLVDLYTKSFIAAWTEAIGKVRIRHLTEGRPTYPLLTAAAAVTSPLVRVLESIHDETSLHDVPAHLADRGQTKVADSGGAINGTSGKSPAALVDDALRPYQQLVEGNYGRRPIDLILSDLNDVRSDLSRLATNTSQADQLSARVEGDLSKLKNETGRLPAPFASMMATIASDVSREIGDSAAARRVQSLRDRVTFTCQETITSRYPFSATAEREVSLADFRRVFEPKGLIDQFSKDNIVSVADTSGSTWKWNDDQPIARQLPASALSDFQKADAIREAFFSDGPSPSFSLAITPPPSSGVRMEIDNASLSGRPANNASVTVQWPGTSENHHASLAVDLGSGRSPATIEKTGLWSLYRLLEAGQLASDGSSVTFALGGRDLRFRLTPTGASKPLALSLFRGFHCPGGT
jgi:type VI secretion system protein ImpL